jgi:hypothetical protein
VAEVFEANGWFIKSMTLDGEDITDKVFDFQADATMVVTYTDQPSKVSGTVKDARGGVSATALVLAFPADRQRWSGYGSNSRLVRNIAASRSGAYAFAHLPAGEYYLIAIDSAEADGWMDPKNLEMLAPQATKLTVREAGPSTVDLTLKAIR